MVKRFQVNHRLEGERILLRGHLVFEEVELVKSYRGRNKFSRSLVPPLDIALVEYSHIFSEPPPILAFFDSSLQEFPFLFVAFGHEKYQQSSIRPKNGSRENIFGETISLHSFKFPLFGNSKTFETYYNFMNIQHEIWSFTSTLEILNGNFS